MQNPEGEGWRKERATKNLATTWNQNTWPANYLPPHTHPLQFAPSPGKQNAAILLRRKIPLKGRQTTIWQLAINFTFTLAQNRDVPQGKFTVTCKPWQASWEMGRTRRAKTVIVLLEPALHTHHWHTAVNNLPGPHQNEIIPQLVDQALSRPLRHPPWAPLTPRANSKATSPKPCPTHSCLTCPCHCPLGWSEDLAFWAGGSLRVKDTRGGGAPPTHWTLSTAHPQRAQCQCWAGPDWWKPHPFI